MQTTHPAGMDSYATQGCPIHFRIWNWLTAGAAAMLLSLGALAQSPYSIPTDARSGRISTQQFPAVTIDGKDYRLAPGARIFNTNHRTITPNLLPPDAPVKFVLNSDGQIQTVWLLEANQK